MSKPNKAKAVNITRACYSMATADGTSAEIIMYGDIYEQQPVDYWTGKPIEGQYILLDEFLNDLEEVAGCKDITIRMNSYGGVCFSSDFSACPAWEIWPYRINHVCRHERRQPYHVRLRYRAGKSVQSHHDTQVLVIPARRLQR